MVHLYTGVTRSRMGKGECPSQHCSHEPILGVAPEDEQMSRCDTFCMILLLVLGTCSLPIGAAVMGVGYQRGNDPALMIGLVILLLGIIFFINFFVWFRQRQFAVMGMEQQGPRGGGTLQGEDEVQPATMHLPPKASGIARLHQSASQPSVRTIPHQDLSGHGLLPDSQLVKPSDPPPSYSEAVSTTLLSSQLLQ